MSNMALIRIYFVEGDFSKQQEYDLPAKISDLITEVTDAAHTMVIIHEIPLDNWMMERLPIAEFKGKLMNLLSVSPAIQPYKKEV